MTKHVLGCAVALATMWSASLGAQTAGQQMPPMPRPGPEQEVLKMEEGTWDATVEMAPAPGAPTQTSKGVEVNTMGCGGLCLISDFKSDMGTMPFHGHGIVTWDMSRKMYSGSWADSMTPGLMISEGIYDPATKKWTGTMEGPDMTGKVMKVRWTGEWRGDATRVFTMYAPGPEGKDVETLRITYTRRP